VKQFNVIEKYGDYVGDMLCSKPDEAVSTGDVV